MSKLSQHQELQQKLTPQQILQASLLQLNAQVLEQRILEEIEQNPALELAEIDDDENREEVAESDDEESPEELDETDAEIVESDFDWEELMGDPDEFEIRQPKDQNEIQVEMPLHTTKTITDRLLDQLRDINASEDELKIAEQVLGNLDEHGYLNIEPVLISDRMSLKEAEVLSVMDNIRDLDPPGFASQNMRECLVAQLKKYGDNDLAMNILVKHFEDFGQRRYEKIIEKLGCTKAALQESITVISQLNPHPGDGFEYSEKDFVIPDICVEKSDEGWQITSNDSSLPPLRVSGSYRQMLVDYSDDKEVRQFVKQKIESAKWFIEAIQQRKTTIIHVMESIIHRQKSYFETDKRQLSPMVLKDIAADIDMDISTISRVTNGRFVQLPWEIKELKTFFSEGISTQSGEDVSNTVVKDRVYEIIQNENKQQPRGDEEITAILVKEGFQIARRTVSKYRENLKFPVARLRREL
jgi:RNA polymerase sigma-54 factor